ARVDGDEPPPEARIRKILQRPRQLVFAQNPAVVDNGDVAVVEGHHVARLVKVQVRRDFGQVGQQRAVQLHEHALIDGARQLRIADADEHVRVGAARVQLGDDAGQRLAGGAGREEYDLHVRIQRLEAFLD